MYTYEEKLKRIGRILKTLNVPFDVAMELAGFFSLADVYPCLKGRGYDVRYEVTGYCPEDAGNIGKIHVYKDGYLGYLEYDCCGMCY